MSRASASPRAASTSNRATLTPWPARRRAVAAPRPDAPPVTTAEIVASSRMTGSPVLAEMAGDDQLLDVARALVDLGDAHVAVVALHRKVVEVAIAAVDLQRSGAHLFGHLAGEELGDRCFLCAADAGLAEPGGVQHVLACHLDLHRHVGQV